MSRPAPTPAMTLPAVAHSRSQACGRGAEAPITASVVIVIRARFICFVLLASTESVLEYSGGRELPQRHGVEKRAEMNVQDGTGGAAKRKRRIPRSFKD